jgi:hypothetical protein
MSRSEKLQMQFGGYVYALAAPPDPLALSFYAEALKRVDFYSIALGLIQAAEAADPSLVTPSVDEEAMAAVFARHRSKPVQLLLEDPVGAHEWHPRFGAEVIGQPWFIDL